MFTQSRDKSRHLISALVSAGLLSAGLAGGGLAVTPAEANPAGTQIVIREAYLNGGSASATYKNKFVELYNPTSSAIDVSGWSLQYRASATTTAFTGITKIGSHHLEPHGVLLVSGNSNGSAGADLPTPDVTGTVAFSGSSGGTIALSKSETALTGDRATVLADPNLVDLLGYGNSATYEGTAKASGWSVTASVGRDANGTDTDNNNVDFAAQSPTPVACGSVCDGPAPTTPAPTTPTPTTPAPTTPIANIQGTSDTSPLAGQTVTTTGVVTADYSTGGFNGAYIQTAGTGGSLDLTTHTASDGLFVYGSGFASAVSVGDNVTVTGKVSEYNGLTELTASTWTKSTATATITPVTVALPLTAAQRESLEGMLIAPQGDYTITDNYDANTYGEIGLAAGAKPLDTPTNVARPGSQAYADTVASNANKLITLDDGASTNYLTNAAAKNSPLPWLRPDNEVRVGAAATFTKPVVLDYRFGLWLLQPQAPLAGAATEPVTFSSTRQSAPTDPGGQLKISSFNVLNYFTLTGDQYNGTCSFYDDRAGNHITVNTCGDSGPRGAASATNLDRQQAKIVEAINGLGADVLSLEEIENSAKFGKDRDNALDALVTALNLDAGSKQWAAVPSPAVVPTTGSDVIRTAFIYRVAKAEPVGTSTILDDPAFTNARAPLAQEFRPVGGSSRSDFLVIANHFKSKGSGDGANADQGDGQGASNLSRKNQATALVAFAQAQEAAAKTDQVFLTGDFNAYNEEDPVRILEDAGFTNLAPKYTGAQTYAFDGAVGSLDHVFASPEATARVTGAAVWNINAYESVAREYSRYNYNVTNLYDGSSPFRSSDHDPVLVGYNPNPSTVASTVKLSGPSSVAFGNAPSYSVTVTADGETPTGTVELRDGSTVLGSRQLVDGSAMFDLTAKALAVGDHTLTVSYTGSATVEPGSDTQRVAVTGTAPTISGTAPRAITAGSAYSYQFQVSGVPSPGVTVASGALPTGIVLSDQGLLSGTATVAGTYTFTLKATNAVGSVTSAAQTIVVSPAAASAVAIKGGNAQSAVVTQKFSEPLSVVVTDAYGNPVAGESVTFKVTSGYASVGGKQTFAATTAGDGVASAGLTAGLLSGPVTVTAGLTGNTAVPVATFTESVQSFFSARADIKVAISGVPANPARGSSFTATVTVSNVGPNVASPVLAAVNVGAGLTIKSGSSVWSVPTLASGASVSHQVTVTVATLPRPFTTSITAGAVSILLDPQLGDNVASSSIRTS